MKGLVKVKGSWGMGGGLRGVASFSFNWLSVSMPVAIFLGVCAARGSMRAAVLCACLGAAALRRVRAAVSLF